VKDDGQRSPHRARLSCRSHPRDDNPLGVAQLISRPHDLPGARSHVRAVLHQKDVSAGESELSGTFR